MENNNQNIIKPISSLNKELDIDYVSGKMQTSERRRKLNEIDTEEKVDFIDDMGDKWQEFTVYHHNLKEWMSITGVTDTTKSPYYGATAPEINWKQRVKMQAIVQKYVTHSISSTINLPNDVSEEEVSNIYLESWKQGLKGITVYRDGSRSGVLVSSDDKGGNEEENDESDDNEE